MEMISPNKKNGVIVQLKVKISHLCDNPEQNQLSPRSTLSCRDGGKTQHKKKANTTTLR